MFKKKKYNIKIEIILIIIGMIIFDCGYFFNSFKTGQYSDCLDMFKSVSLTYPLLYLCAAIIIIICRVYKKKNCNK